MPLILYQNPASPPCTSVMILAKMIGVELQVKETGYEELQTEPFLKVVISQIDGTVPFRFFISICSDQKPSRAIMGYLVQQYAKNDQLYPKDPKKRGKVDNMLHFDVGNLHAALAEDFEPPTVHGQPVIAEAKDKVKDRLSILNTILSKQPYVAGDSLSLADISIRCSLAVPSACGYGNYGEHPNVAKWIERFDKEVPMSNDLIRVLSKLVGEWVSDSLNKFGLDPNIFHL